MVVVAKGHRKGGTKPNDKKSLPLYTLMEFPSALKQFGMANCIYLGITNVAHYYAQIINSKKYCINFSEDHFCLSKQCLVDPEGGTGGPGPTPLKLAKIGFRSNNDPDHLKSTRLPRASIQWWAIIGTPAKRHFNGLSLAGR